MAQKYGVQDHDMNNSSSSHFGCFGFCTGSNNSTSGNREYKRRKNVRRIPLSQNMPFAACRGETDENIAVTRLR